MKRLFEHFLNTGEKNLGNNSIMFILTQSSLFPNFSQKYDPLNTLIFLKVSSNIINVSEPPLLLKTNFV